MKPGSGLRGSPRSCARVRRWGRPTISRLGCAIRSRSPNMKSNRPNSARTHRTKHCLNTRLIPDPRKVKLRVYQTNSTHKSMSALRQGSMLLVKDVEFHSVEAQFHEAVFTHASTSPNQQLIASLDVARRQMELEGYGLVHNAIEIALEIRAGGQRAPADLQIFPHSRRRQDGAGAYRESGFTDYSGPQIELGGCTCAACRRTSSASTRRG